MWRLIPVLLKLSFVQNQSLQYNMIQALNKTFQLIILVRINNIVPSSFNLKVKFLIFYINRLLKYVQRKNIYNPILMNQDDLQLLARELAKASNIRPKPKINPGPTKSKLVEGNVGFNEGFNSAEYYAKQQTGKSPDEISPSTQTQAL